VLDGIDLAVNKGEVFALVGPSGSGKSTLLKMISGIDSPDQGQVFLAGREVTALPAYRRAVHTVFQNYALFPHLDVAANVAFPLRVAGMNRRDAAARVQTALGWVHMAPFASRRVTTLSGGERQRVALARALVDEPQCVLLDEPLSALDPHLRAQTLELLQEIQSRLGVTYLYVTHDREEALRAAHRVGVLNAGRLEQVGAPEEVYRHPRTPFVASFVGPMNWFVGEVSTCDGQRGVRLNGGEWLPLDAPLPGRVRLGVRPENVQLGERGFLQGRVVSRQFSGASVALKLAAESGVLIAAELPSHGCAPGVGETTWVSWAPEAAHWFPEIDGESDR
jgi:ABC-type Fe3+/spermidine/putrescine transport system ATPase subunit